MASSDELFEQIRIMYEKDKYIDTTTVPSSIYMIARFLSLEDAGTVAADLVNNYSTMPDPLKLPVMFHTTVQRNRPWSRYPKKDKTNLNKTDINIINKIQKRFNLNDEHALQYYELFKAQGVDLNANYYQE